MCIGVYGLYKNCYGFGRVLEQCRSIIRRLISWQCKKQTVVVNSTTEAEYVVAASSCRQKQKLDENIEAEVDDEAEMKKHMEIVPNDDVAIDAIPLTTKPPIIVDWKIIKEGKMGYFQIIKADGSSKRPEEAYERVLWGDLKVMFEPNVEKKRYPLTPATITEMLNKKLQADHWNEMCYQLLKLKLMTKQLKNPRSV
ncbi:hypothetical protein Tco_1034538 [Tanacetum coccineum]